MMMSIYMEYLWEFSAFDWQMGISQRSSFLFSPKDVVFWQRNRKGLPRAEERRDVEIRRQAIRLLNI